MNSAAPKIPLKIETKINHYANETFTQLMHEHPIFPIRKAKEHSYFKEIMVQAIRELKNGMLTDEQLEGLRKYVEMLKMVLAEYESRHFAFEKPAVMEILEFLKTSNNLTQADIAEILGVSQAQVSRILGGERELTREQIRKLSQKFNVSPALFF